MYHQHYNSFGDMMVGLKLWNESFHPNHFHRSLEIVYVLEGEVDATVDGKPLVLKKDDFLMVFPLSVHSLTIGKDNSVYIMIVTEPYIKSFFNLIANKAPSSPVFRCSEITCNYIRKHLVEKYPRFTNAELFYKSEIPSDSFVFMLKSCFYAICMDFTEQVQLLPMKKTNVEIEFRILEYIQNNFRENITIQTLSQEFGYNQEYMSRIINRKFKMNLKALVNTYRYENAYRLLTESDKSISEIALESGFQSIRTFNRICLEISGKSPSDIRTHNKKRA